ncbi:MAG: DUF859 domain-containing protein [Erysipelotrichales bacterium]|nr:DUF859 domain-containing protein [Erysipelotrichales bacterium]
MASSGTIKSSIYKSHLWLTFDWSQSSQNITNNTTTISWSLKLHWDARLNFSASKKYSVTVNGTTYSGSYTGGTGNTTTGTKTLCSKTTTISHNSDGSKSFSVSANFDIQITYSGSTLSTMTLSGSQTLNTIPRASSISSLTSSITINGTNSLTVNINRKSTAFTHTVTFKLGSYSQSFTSVATSQTYTLPITWLNALTSSSSLSGTCTVTTYSGSTQIGSSVSSSFTAYRPSASTISLASSSIDCNGSNQLKLSISRVHSSFTHTVKYIFGNYTQTFENITTSSNYTVPTSWLNTIPNATSGVGKVTVSTYYGSLFLGSHVLNFTLKVPTSIIPRISSVTDTIINPTSIASWNMYLKNISQCRLNISAVGNLGSSISKIYVNDIVCSSSYTDSSLNKSGSKTYQIYVVDSRGRKSSTLTKTITIVDYELPTIKVNQIYRCLQDGTKDDEGTCVLINASYTISSCDHKNMATRLIQSKESTSSYYSNKGSFEQNIDIILDGYIMNKSYDFLLTVTDTVGKTATYHGEGIIPTATAIIDVLNGGSGIAFGKMASEQETIDCGWPIKAPYFIDEDGNKISLDQILIFVGEN